MLLKHLENSKGTSGVSLEDIAQEIADEVEAMDQNEYNVKRAGGWNPTVEANERYNAARERSRGE